MSRTYLKYLTLVRLSFLRFYYTSLKRRILYFFSLSLTFQNDVLKVKEILSKNKVNVVLIKQNDVFCLLKFNFIVQKDVY